ncbi:hypothetical protein N0V93_003125 [Gnomoniopsis smithogilvyi]|uniref:Uncharacterized protein n=1 Tax=Gnomoniopsis smithogilvyi TaxID=1191159 RepID=A0A9W8YXY5_9PEZI|nr:hypothetical protein N0V93_003125 [Gnomoniopsis smithogilvyi]
MAKSAILDGRLEPCTVTKRKHEDAIDLENETPRRDSKAVEKCVADLDNKVKAISGDSMSMGTAIYANSAGKHMKLGAKLADVAHPLGFYLLLSLANASHMNPERLLQNVWNAMCQQRLNLHQSV